MIMCASVFISATLTWILHPLPNPPPPPPPPPPSACYPAQLLYVMVEILNEVLNQIFRAHITKFCHKYLLIILIFIRALPYLPVCPNHILQRLVKKTSTLPTTHPPTLSGAFDQLCAAQRLSCYLWRPAPWENTFDLFLIGHVLSLARARVRAHALDLELKVLTCHVHLYTVKFTRKDKRCAGALLGDGFEELAPNKRSGDGRGRRTDRQTDWLTDGQTDNEHRYISLAARYTWRMIEGQSELQENCGRAVETAAWHVEGNPPFTLSHPSPLASPVT